MPLSYILRRVRAESGITDDDSIEYLKDRINEAAREIYRRSDLPISLQECYIRATSNAELALPPFIGELRAVRSTNWSDQWELFDMRPRYNSREWPNIWKNWRIKGYSPTKIEIINAAPVSIEVPTADSDLIITFVGETVDSNNARDSVVMTTTEEEGSKSFTLFKAIAKNKVTDYNVTVLDADGNELAIIYADQLDARYVIVDVSQYPNLESCADGTYTMEVLYKPRCPILYNDEDVFPVDGMDDAIVIKTLQLLEEGKPGNEQRALLMHEKAKDLVEDIVNDRTGTLSKKIGFKRNPLFGVFRRYPYK
jgi:hypothetical protein